MTYGERGGKRWKEEDSPSIRTKWTASAGGKQCIGKAKRIIRKKRADAAASEKSKKHQSKEVRRDIYAWRNITRKRAGWSFKHEVVSDEGKRGEEEEGGGWMRTRKEERKKETRTESERNRQHQVEASNASESKKQNYCSICLDCWRLFVGQYCCCPCCCLQRLGLD